MIFTNFYIQLSYRVVIGVKASSAHVSIPVPEKKLSKGLLVPKNSAKVALGSPWKVYVKLVLLLFGFPEPTLLPKPPENRNRKMSRN